MPKPGMTRAVVGAEPAPELIQARKIPSEEHLPNGPRSTRYRVMCPMLGTEVVLQRCDFCPHGKEWIFDQETETVMLRCSFLARDR